MRSSSIDASAMRSVPRIRQARKIMENSIEHSNRPHNSCFLLASVYSSSGTYRGDTRQRANACVHMSLASLQTFRRPFRRLLTQWCSAKLPLSCACFLDQSSNHYCKPLKPTRMLGIPAGLEVHMGMVPFERPSITPSAL